jgi:hypothetical protein
VRASIYPGKSKKARGENMNAIDWILILIEVSAIAAIVYLYFKRSTPKVSADDSEPIQGTDAERLSAEQALREMPIDMREELVSTHELFDRYSTRQGFSKEYFDDVSRQLRDAGIANYVYFQPAAPLGSMGSIIEEQGLFELYIEKGKRREAQEILKAVSKF